MSNQLFAFQDSLVVARNRRDAGRIVREEYGLTRSFPLRLVPPSERHAMTTDGEDECVLTAGEIASGKPGIIPEW